MEGSTSRQALVNSSSTTESTFNEFHCFEPHCFGVAVSQSGGRVENFSPETYFYIGDAEEDTTTTVSSTSQISSPAHHDNTSAMSLVSSDAATVATTTVASAAAPAAACSSSASSYIADYQPVSTGHGVVLDHSHVTDAQYSPMPEIETEFDSELAAMIKQAGERLSTFSKLDPALHSPGANRFISSDSEAHMMLNQEDNHLHYSNGGLPPSTKSIDPESGHTYFDHASYNRIKVISVAIQVLVAIILSSAGNFGAGIILDIIQNWTVFHHVPELYYLIPTLLGLKGNLEMTMVARLSTLANMGGLNTFQRAMKCMVVNISLVQCQAIVVSFLASTVTFLATYYESSHQDLPSGSGAAALASVGLVANGTITMNSSQIVMAAAAGGSQTVFYTKLLVIFSTSLATANAACFGSSMFMILIIVLLSNYKINPDNFATAIAASIGDIVTSFLLGIIGEYIYNSTVYLPGFGQVDPGVHYFEDLRSPVCAISIIVFFLVLFPMLAYVACSDKATKNVLIGFGAWMPIIVAMVISFFSGATLRFGAVMFKFMTLFQPLINGVGGNLAAITTSRLSTELHMSSSQHGNTGHSVTSNCQESFLAMLRRTLKSFFIIRDQQNILIVIFVLISISVQLFYGYLLPLFHSSDRYELTILFYMFYLFASAFQVLILLMLTRFVVNFIWWIQADPDTCAIPILTALGDLIGTLLLYSVFAMLKSLHDSSAIAPIDISDDILASPTATSPMSAALNLVPMSSTILMGFEQYPFVNYSSTTNYSF